MGNMCHCAISTAKNLWYALYNHHSILVAPQKAGQGMRRKYRTDVGCGGALGTAVGDCWR